jgi:hypothetical protein
MKKLLLSACILLLSIFTYAQDEGTAVAQARFARSKSFYVSGGPALTLGKNLGDYGTGISFETGYTKRLNKLLSIGPNFSFLSFKYDESKTYPYYYDSFNDVALEFSMDGGDVSLISLGCNFKLNFVPVGDATTFSIYGIANPFVSYVTRKEFQGSAEFFTDGNQDGVYDDSQGVFDYGVNEEPDFAEDSKISGGVHLGFGFEIMPTKPVSFFMQATFSYTLKIGYAATESFLKDDDRYVDANNRVYYEADNSVYLKGYPIAEKGFSALSIKAGVSFNF